MKVRGGLYLSILSLAATGAVAAEETTELPEVLVSAQMELTPATISVPIEELELGIPADGGDLLRNIPGVDGSRMGGHGIDPIVRGQIGNRLNVISDGAYAFGGCPNRMDPPTVFVNLDEAHDVTVIKGSQTVVYGGGGSGGTILFERDTPRFEEGEQYRFRLDGGLMSNSDTGNISGDVAFGTRSFFARGNGHYKTADNYKDGNGDEVRSAYNTEGGGVTLGYTPSDNTRLEVSFDHAHDYDALFAGAGMDSPYSDSDQYRLRFERDEATGPFKSVTAEAYAVDVDHLMDNYSLREQTAKFKMRVPSTSDTHGGRIAGVMDVAGSQWTLGIDYIDVARDATRYWDYDKGKSGGSFVENSFLWPDVTRSSLGLFAEMERRVGDNGTVTFGLRYDHVAATISQQRADQQPVGPAWAKSANQLYQMYYGIKGDDQNEDNIGGVLRYTHDFGGGWELSGGVSRAVRTADATERYIAANNMVAASRWIGNPGLDPEKHHEIDIELSKVADRWRTSLDLFYDDVGDFILRDRAHGQSGILQDDDATIYRNVDAYLTGGEWYGHYNITDRWTAAATLAYTYAQNTTDSSAIAQIPPLNGTFNLNYDTERWTGGVRVKWSDTQGRVDDDIETGSGLDVGETAGWWTMDLYGKSRIQDWGELKLGVNNLFDRAYAYHVNRANIDPFNPEAIQVNEPGRTFWVSASVKF